MLLCFVIAAPGLVTFETKLGVVLDPWKFLGDLGQLWSDESGFGGLTNQYIGYLFPMLPFYALTDLIGLPVWLAERLWLALVVTTAFWGALRLAERLRIGSPATRLVGATAYALWPTFTIIVGSTSAGALPGAVLPWVLLPLMSERLSARVAAATSALIIPFMGGVNAASTLCALLPVGLYLVTRTGRRRTSLLLWWLPGALLATLWWTIPLMLMGSYVENFMAYVEQAWNTTSTMSAVEMLRGTGNWVGYLNFGSAWLPAGWLLVTGVLAIIGTTLAAALGLAGLARRDMPERRWLMLTAIVVTAVMLAGYAGSLGAPFAEGVQSLLDGALKPFRNIYKFQPGLALALALGLAHLVAVFARSDGARPLPGRRFLPALAAALVLPAMALPYLNGDVLQPGGFKELPKHWQQTADWLEDNSPENRALVVPSTAHGIYTWGSPIDQPLHVLAESPWAQRDYVPFGTPGERRMMDAVEQALMSGGEVPGLSDYLGRAGLHNVVVRNDLDPDQVGYVPPQTVKRTLEASGYKKVKDFGPTVTAGRIPADTPIEIQGFYPRQKSVEIYEPAETKRPSQVAAQPVSETARLSGGPESMLPLSADPNFRDRPVVLTGDNHPGIGNPSLQVNGDGLRRADTRFGLINNNTSYTYTKDEKNHEGSLQDAGKEPKQILPSPQLKHQTVAELRGAKNVTASSSGSWLFHMPQFDPVNAFDGNPESGWAEASAGDSTGEWIKVDFDGATDIPGSIDLTPLAGDGVRPSVTGVKVETDRGSEESTLQPNDGTQRVKAPRGTAKWLKLTITDVQESRAGITGAGFAEIEIPDVQVTRMLALPNDAPGDRTESEIYSMHRSPDPGGLNPAGIESGLHRQFTSERSAEYTLKASATPVPGSAYDDMLDEIAPGSRDRITASAESVSPTGVSLSARNLVDGDLTTAWIAGDKPVIRLSWPEKTEVDSMVLSAAGGVSAKPAEVEITSDDGAVTTSVDENGWARFEAMETDSMQITITKTAPTTLHNPVAGDDIQLPVGLNELHVPALEDFRVEAPAADRKFELECGDGPMVAIDGTLHATKASGKVSDLTERRPISVELCAGDQKNGTIELDSGKHTLETGSGGPLAINDLTLTRGDTAPKASAERAVTVKDWAGEAREVEVGSGEASYLRTHMNINKGWKATLDGKELTSLRLDGWQQGYLVPAGEGGTVKLEYTPTTYYQGGLAVAGVGIVGLLGMAFIRRRGGEPLGAQDAAPAPSWVLGGVVLTLVFALIAGPYALIVPALAVVAWLRPRWLVPLSAAAMLGAGVIVALGAGDGYAADAGAFGWPAQALALLALAAALVTVPQRERAEEPQDERPSYTEPAPASAGGMPAPTLPHRHPEQQQGQQQQTQQPQQNGPAQQDQHGPQHGGPSAPPGEEPSR
ncbi:alpha-(1-_3)-arabinofuranosyltransferase domain-containing protein [Streptomyces tardus]|uniref:alpha-(1->3)-arabinofuranosyltransferase domain-containing protein n=1 Tax=Streptomyces tardus TaxID=2780544 RepID=UPI0035586EDA